MAAKQQTPLGRAAGVAAAIGFGAILRRLRRARSRPVEVVGGIAEPASTGTLGGHEIADEHDGHASGHRHLGPPPGDAGTTRRRVKSPRYRSGTRSRISRS